MIKNRKYYFKSKYGVIEISYNGNTVISIKKIVKAVGHDEFTEKSQLKNDFLQKVEKELQEYFHGTRKSFNFTYEPEGTEFQKKVWKALEEIPYGETRTYKEIATNIGNPNASRAVGMANNKNPLMIVIPCHRVIGSNGKLVGYAGGLEMKKDLLEMEKRRL